MQKVKILLVLLIVTIVGFFYNVKSTRAQGYCAGDWVCECPGGVNPVTGYCTLWECVCDDGGGVGCECPSGYSCDRFGGCNRIEDGGGGGGGGGGWSYPTCGGQVLKCGNDPNVYVGGGGGETNNSDLAHCEFRADCGNDYFPSVFSVTECDGKPSKGICQINCDCCNAGDDYVKSTTTGSNYTREIGCNSFVSSLYCSDWDDIFVSRSVGTGTGVCYKGCDGEVDPETGKCYGQKYTVYNDIVTCTSVTTTWSCVPTCTATSPSTPTLLSPSNGASVSSTNVSLIWNNLTQTWGDSCTTNNNQFEVYIGTSPASLALMGTVGSGTGSVAFSGTNGNTYYWRIRAKNGSLNTDSPIITAQDYPVAGQTVHEYTNAQRKFEYSRSFIRGRFWAS